MQVSRDLNNKTLSIVALEGLKEGRLIARVEQIQLANAEATHEGIVGDVRAVWGAELESDLDNRTILGLSIGKPFVPGGGIVLSPGQSTPLKGVGCDAPMTPLKLVA